MNRVRSKRWIVGLAAGLLLLAGTARAGFLSTRSALPNFHFLADTITYDLGPAAFTLADDETGSVISTSAPDGLGPNDPRDPLSGGLCFDHRAGGVGSMKHIDLSLFGSVPTAQSRTQAERLEDGLTAAQIDKHDDALGFLTDDRPTTGDAVGRMQSAGIYVQAAGIDLAVWIDGYKNGAPAQQLLALEDAVKSGRASPEALAMPLPGTLGLFLVGIPLLAGRRRPER
jgi:hypothetical protein